ncbi:hypothetical protein O7635_11490 [Asanoa sp. WMMD1127]|uniref:hypothetical protein n=1 Tax=Asanoa sp. WMMD1127 TaxID=3016107 RepID=UPI002418041A|nr:hypothetical protein [Asanoa sp. WMMD1127]MDG4822473.1 hypothetical protein [Asanoa sp. WMMD1127]
MGFGEVEKALSPARVEPYLRGMGGDRPAAIRLYEWNTAISGAFYESLAHLEVGLRNGINDQLRAMAHRDDWWDSPALTLTASALDMLVKAKGEVARRANSKPGHVVAALPFGFWVGLLSAGRGCNYETTLWRPAIHRAFPHYRGPRAPLHQRLETLRLLRNRIAHHEPIHRRHLAADYGTLLLAAGWLSADFAVWIRSTSRIPAVLAARPPIP